jgi:hypothetical protein
MKRVAKRAANDLLMVVAFALVPVISASQTSYSDPTHSSAIPIPSTDLTITIDGLIDEEAWESARLFDLEYETEPGENTPAPVRTEALVIFDKYKLYVAFRCYDPEPSKIRAHYSDRDSNNDDDDVLVELDTFNDERRSIILESNPFGVQTDWKYSASGYDRTWDTIYETKGRITEWGWVVEFSIPFSSLQFQRKEGVQTWGLLLSREYPREVRRDLRIIPLDRNNNCRLCQYTKIEGFAGVSPGKNMEINPTVTAVRTSERVDFPEGDFEPTNEDLEVGLTARLGVTPNLYFTGTVNPDFSQVEADSLQLDINQPFALFYPEKRPFFTEGADIFETLLNAVYTRTMRDPQWGLKLTGKEGANAIGAYVVRDGVTNLIFPGNQGSSSSSLVMNNTSSVLRFNRDTWNNSTVGVLLTDREGEDYFNRLFSFDGNIRLSRRDTVQIQAMRSSTRYPDSIVTDYSQPPGEFADTALSFEYDHVTRNEGWWVDYEKIGDDFRADLGFMPRVGYGNVEGGWSYRWIAEPGIWWSNVRVSNDYHYFWDSAGDLLYRSANFQFSYLGKLQSRAVLNGVMSREFYNGQVFDNTEVNLFSGFNPVGNLFVHLNTRYGNRIDYANTRPGNRIQIEPRIRGSIGKHLSFNLEHVFERMTAKEDRLYSANISQAKLTYNINVRAFFRSIIQYINYDYNVDNYTFDTEPEYRQLLSQFLFAYQINARTLLYVGYYDNHFGGRDYDMTRNDYSFFAKVGYAWVP